MDLKGHTGMMMTLGQGALMSFLRGQKLNVRSSTEAELLKETRVSWKKGIGTSNPMVKRHDGSTNCR